LILWRLLSFLLFFFLVKSLAVVSFLVDTMRSDETTLSFISGGQKWLASSSPFKKDYMSGTS
jgi:hypothetical protein